MGIKFLPVLILASIGAQAADEDQWRVDWTPYIWAANMKVDANIGPVEASGELGFDDIIDKASGAYMHYLEASKGNWGIANEIIYFDLSDTLTGPIAPVESVNVGLKEAIVDLSLAYHPSSWDGTTFYGGARYINLDMDLGINFSWPEPLPQNASADGGDSWTHLLLGARHIIEFNDKWSMMVKGDYASDYDNSYSYIATLGAGYQFTDLLSLKFGYRIAAIKYEDKPLTLNQDVDGAFVGLGFSW